MPPTPGGVPQTPGAGGWMEDIKRLIKFDSVEEFWGYVLYLNYLVAALSIVTPDCIITSSRHRNYLPRPIITCLKYGASHSIIWGRALIYYATG